MAIKYVCPKCNRRFTQWGAEKFGFKCPDDEWRPKDHPEDVELVRLGPSDDRPSRRPALKKGARKLAVSLPAGYGDETAVSEVDDLETAAEFQGGGGDFEDAEVEDDEAADEEVAAEAVIEPTGDEEIPADAELGEEIDIEGEEGESGDEESTEGETVEEDWQE
ncbi:MAG: hypothetical protein IT366_18975 [Candidatus Hydrogenedentes bacterium]|nr:hypothetical protein [Candidatus Hydrogenedentota bacterium]